MQNTTNFNLQKPDYNNVADIGVLNGNFDKIDKGLTLDVGASTGTGNNYVLNLGSITLTSANKGISFKFWADKDSNGAVTINGTYSLVKPNGKPIKNIKRNAPYTITYDGGTNFFLASGGVDDVSFSASDLLSGKTANNSDGEKVTGTMPNIGQQTATINAGGRVNISKGYHDGTGYIQSNSMGTQLSNLGVTLTSASQLVSGVKAVDKTGKLITGTADVHSLGGVYKVVRHIELSEIAITKSNTITAKINLILPVTPRAIKFYGKLHYQENTYQYDYYVNVEAIGWKLDGGSNVIFFNSRGNYQQSNGATISDLIVASGATFTNIATSTIKDSQVYCEYMY